MAADIKLKPFTAGIAVPKELEKLEILNNVPKICFNNAVILFALTAFADLTLSWQFGSGMLAGGIIAIINFYWLALTVKKSIALQKDRIKGFMAVRYWMRFSMIAIVIFHLVSRNIIIPAAFIAGFTLVTAGTFLAILSISKKEGI